ncbi:hypothetical protein HYQ46_005707 [Verticillium longisporum]|nr:hypothetical protein HYQ46_005707 [Verticillium longisporum]
MARRRVPGRERDGLDGLGSIFWWGRYEVRNRSWRAKSGLSHWLRLLSRRLIFVPLGAMLRSNIDRVQEREAGQDTLDYIGTVARTTDELTDPNKMYAGLLFGVGILNQRHIGVFGNAGNF